MTTENSKIVGGTGRRISLAVKTVLTALLLIVYLFPFYMIILNSFKVKRDIIKQPLAWGGKHGLSFDNYVEAFKKMDYLSAVGNSLLITCCSVALIIRFSSMAAYLFVRTTWKVCGIMFTVMIFSMVIPFQVVMIPLVSIYGGMLHILNHRWLLIFMHLGFSVSMSVFMYHGFIRSSVPISLEEAAGIDGASPFRTFWQIVFPLLKPITATLVILYVLAIWNDYLLPSLILKKGMYTLPLATNAFYGTHSNDLDLLLAALVMTIIPIILLYIALQKYIIQGVVAGAVKS